MAASRRSWQSIAAVSDVAGDLGEAKQPASLTSDRVDDDKGDKAGAVLAHPAPLGSARISASRASKVSPTATIMPARGSKRWRRKVTCSTTAALKSC